MDEETNSKDECEGCPNEGISQTHQHLSCVRKSEIGVTPSNSSSSTRRKASYLLEQAAVVKNTDSASCSSTNQLNDDKFKGDRVAFIHVGEGGEAQLEAQLRGAQNLDIQILEEEGLPDIDESDIINGLDHTGTARDYVDDRHVCTSNCPAGCQGHLRPNEIVIYESYKNGGKLTGRRRYKGRIIYSSENAASSVGPSSSSNPQPASVDTPPTPGTSGSAVSSLSSSSVKPSPSTRVKGKGGLTNKNKTTPSPVERTSTVPFQSSSSLTDSSNGSANIGGANFISHPNHISFQGLNKHHRRHNFQSTTAISSNTTGHSGPVNSYNKGWPQSRPNPHSFPSFPASLHNQHNGDQSSIATAPEDLTTTANTSSFQIEAEDLSLKKRIRTSLSISENSSSSRRANCESTGSYNTTRHIPYFDEKNKLVGSGLRKGKHTTNNSSSSISLNRQFLCDIDISTSLGSQQHHLPQGLSPPLLPPPPPLLSSPVTHTTSSQTNKYKRLKFSVEEHSAVDQKFCSSSGSSSSSVGEVNKTSPGLDYVSTTKHLTLDRSRSTPQHLESSTYPTPCSERRFLTDPKTENITACRSNNHLFIDTAATTSSTPSSSRNCKGGRLSNKQQPLLIQPYHQRPQTLIASQTPETSQQQNLSSFLANTTSLNQHQSRNPEEELNLLLSAAFRQQHQQLTSTDRACGSSTASSNSTSNGLLHALTRHHTSLAQFAHLPTQGSPRLISSRPHSQSQHTNSSSIMGAISSKSANKFWSNGVSTSSNSYANQQSSSTTHHTCPNVNSTVNNHGLMLRRGGSRSQRSHSSNNPSTTLVSQNSALAGSGVTRRNGSSTVAATSSTAPVIRQSVSQDCSAQQPQNNVVSAANDSTDSPPSAVIGGDDDSDSSSPNELLMTNNNYVSEHENNNILNLNNNNEDPLTGGGGASSALDKNSKKRANKLLIERDLVRVPTRIDILLDKPPLPKRLQVPHVWNDDDRSYNIFIKEDDPFTFHRHPVAQSTDCIRGRMCYEKGLHLFQIKWPINQRGTHAVVGVSTEKAPVHSVGYQSLVGNNEHSWGWDLGRCKVYHDSKMSPGKSYPEAKYIRQLRSSSNGSQGGCGSTGSSGEGTNGNGNVSSSSAPKDSNAVTNSFTVPESFLMALDMDKGCMSFLINKNEYLGPAFKGELRGKKVYLMVSAVWGHCEIAMKYIGAFNGEPCLKDLCRRVIRQESRQTTTKNGLMLSPRLSIDNRIPSTVVEYLNYESVMDSPHHASPSSSKSSKSFRRHGILTLRADASSTSAANTNKQQVTRNGQGGNGISMVNSDTSHEEVDIEEEGGLVMTIDSRQHQIAVGNEESEQHNISMTDNQDTVDTAVLCSNSNDSIPVSSRSTTKQMTAQNAVRQSTNSMSIVQENSSHSSSTSIQDDSGLMLDDSSHTSFSSPPSTSTPLTSSAALKRRNNKDNMYSNYGSTTRQQQAPPPSSSHLHHHFFTSTNNVGGRNGKYHVNASCSSSRLLVSSSSAQNVSPTPAHMSSHVRSSAVTGPPFLVDAASAAHLSTSSEFSVTPDGLTQPNSASSFPSSSSSLLMDERERRLLPLFSQSVHHLITTTSRSGGPTSSFTQVGHRHGGGVAYAPTNTRSSTIPTPNEMAYYSLQNLGGGEGVGLMVDHPQPINYSTKR